MKILFICTHNRCRSILSEAITNALGGDNIEAFSAGSQPVGEVHPLSLKYLTERGYSIEGLKSQSWNDFADQRPDVVITVCDSAAKETCPVWFGDCIQVHWGLPDPSKLQGSESEIRDAFFKVMDTIEDRVKALRALDLNHTSENEIRAALLEVVEGE